MRLARIVGLGLLAATLSAMAAQAQPLALSPDGIAETSVAIDCGLSPFGKAVPLVRDLEPMLQAAASAWPTGTVLMPARRDSQTNVEV